MSADERLNVTVDLLRSIDASLKTIARALVKAAPPEIADDRELDSQYGDPEVKFMPRDWTGDDYKGARMSECPAELLDMLAETFDYFARKAEANNEQTNSGKPVAPYKRKDAARARGWAKRNRVNGPRVSQPVAAGFGDESEWPEGQELTADDIAF